MSKMAWVPMMFLLGCDVLPPVPPPDIVIDGVNVVDETVGKKLLIQPTFSTRFNLVVEAAIKYSGGSLEDVDGWTVVFRPGYSMNCPAFNNDPGPADGCAIQDNKLIVVVLKGWGDCIEHTALAHEILHAVIWDPDHLDPRWTDVAGYVADAIEPAELGMEEYCGKYASQHGFEGDNYYQEYKR